MTKTIAIILAAVLVVGGGVTAGVVVSNNNLPENVVKDALLGLTEVLDRAELKPLYETFTNGSIEMSQTYIRQDSDTETWTNSAKIYFANDGVVLQDIHFEESGLTLQGELWLTEDFVCINAENFFQDAYALELGKLAKQFEQSIFAYGSQSKYAIQDQQTYADVLSLLDHLDKLNTRKMQKEVSKITSNYLAKLWEIACDQVDFEEGTIAMEIDGKKVDVRNINIVVDADDVCEIWEATLEFLQEDEQVTKFLDKNEDLLNIANNPIFGAEQTTNQTLSDTYREMLKQLKKEFYTTAAEIQESWGDNQLVIDVATPKNKSELLKLNANYANKDVYTLDFDGKNIKDTNKITLVQEGIKSVYEVIDGDKRFVATYTVDKTEVLNFQLDKETYNYTLTYSETNYDTPSPSSIKLEGRIIDGADLKITVDQVTEIVDNIWWEEPMETTYQLDLQLILRNKDKLPEKPDGYKTLETLTEEDVDKLLQDLLQVPEYN